MQTRLDWLLDAGVNQHVVAHALGISRRTVTRYVAARRARAEPKTLWQLLDELPTLDEILADLKRDWAEQDDLAHRRS